MNTFFYQSIEDIFTQSRLSVYKKDGVDDITCLARYLFNIELCKSLYPALHILENKNIKSLQKIFEKMRLLRNRVSHYERLIHWKDLKDQHLQLLECIQWLNVESYNLVKGIDCFDAVFSAGIQPFKTLVQNNWN